MNTFRTSQPKEILQSGTSKRRLTAPPISEFQENKKPENAIQWFAAGHKTCWALSDILVFIVFGVCIVYDVCLCEPICAMVRTQVTGMLSPTGLWGVNSGHQACSAPTSFSPTGHLMCTPTYFSTQQLVSQEHFSDPTAFTTRWTSPSKTKVNKLVTMPLKSHSTASHREQVSWARGQQYFLTLASFQW